MEQNERKYAGSIEVEHETGSSKIVDISEDSNGNFWEGNEVTGKLITCASIKYGALSGGFHEALSAFLDDPQPDRVNCFLSDNAEKDISCERVWSHDFGPYAGRIYLYGAGRSNEEAEADCAAIAERFASRIRTLIGTEEEKEYVGYMMQQDTFDAPQTIDLYVDKNGIWTGTAHEDHTEQENRKLTSSMLSDYKEILGAFLDGAQNNRNVKHDYYWSGRPEETVLCKYELSWGQWYGDDAKYIILYGTGETKDEAMAKCFARAKQLKDLLLSFGFTAVKQDMDKDTVKKPNQPLPKRFVAFLNPLTQEMRTRQECMDWYAAGNVDKSIYPTAEDWFADMLYLRVFRPMTEADVAKEKAWREELS